MKKVAVLGVGMVSFDRHKESLLEMLAKAAVRALAVDHVGLVPAPVDASGCCERLLVVGGESWCGNCAGRLGLEK
jgi:acetyl-CoA acetyltransferase